MAHIEPDYPKYLPKTKIKRLSSKDYNATAMLNNLNQVINRVDDLPHTPKIKQINNRKSLFAHAKTQKNF